MKTSIEVLTWLKRNAYAVKGDDYYLMTDFPQNEVPDRLHIPLKKRAWREIRGIDATQAPKEVKRH